MKQEQLRVQILKVFQFQIKSREQDYLDVLQQHGVLHQFIDQLFQKSIQTSTSDDSQLPISWLEMKCHQFRKKALETAESLGPVPTLSSTIQDQRYIAFRQSDPSKGAQGAVSYPISGAINIQMVLRNQSYSCQIDREITQLAGETLEMVLLNSALFENNPQVAFKLMMSSYITVVSEDLDAKQLFSQMRRLSLQDPKSFTGLSEKIVIFMEQTDFQEVYSQNSLILDLALQKGNSEIKSSVIQGLCQDLQEWGQCSQEMIYQIEQVENKSFDNLKSTIHQCLDPNQLLKLQEKTDKNKKMAQSEDQMLDNNSNSKTSIQEGEQQLPSLKNNEYKDLHKINSIWRKLEDFIAQIVVPFEEKEEEQVHKKDQDFYQCVVGTVNQCSGIMMQKQYLKSLKSLSLATCRFTFLTILEHSDLSIMLPHLLSSEQNKRQFAIFLKMQYNEAIKMQVSNKKESLSFLKNIIKKILTNEQEQLEKTPSFIEYFYEQQVLMPSFEALEKVRENDKPIIQQEYFENEDLAIKYASPRLFKFMTKLIMTKVPQLFTHNVTLLPNALNLTLAYSMYLGQQSTKNKKKYLFLVLDIVYFVKDQFKEMDFDSLDKIVNNRIIKTMGESLKNVKSNEKSTQSQKVITEIYLQLLNLASLISEHKKKFDLNLCRTRYLASIEKIERIVKECNNKQIDYMKYLIFYKAMDKEVLKFLNDKVQTSHKMYNCPISIYKKINQVQKMKINIKNTTQLPPFTSFAITSDREGQNVIQHVSSDNLTDDIGITLYRNDFYLHYPAVSSVLVGFGSQDGGKLGNKKTQGNTLPIIINTNFQNKTQIKELAACRNYSMILDSNDEIHISGYLRGTAQREEYKIQKLPNSIRVLRFAAGKYNILVQGVDQNWYVIGRNRLGHIGPASENIDSFKQLSVGMEALQNQNIISFKTGTHFSAFVSDTGKLFTRGNAFHKILGLPEESKVVEIVLEEHIIVKEVYCSISKKHYPMCIIDVYDSKLEKRMLHSAGKNDYGVLGQGKDIKEAKTFQPLNIDVSFSTISIYERMALGITHEGELYGWGLNEKGMLGIPEQLDQFIWKPTKVDYFENYIVHKALCSYLHSVVIASHKKGTLRNIQQVFTMGAPADNDKLAIVGINLPDKLPKTYIYVQNKPIFIWHLKEFDKLNIKKVSVAQNSTFFYIDNQEYQENLKKHTLPNQKECFGILHFYFQDDNIQYVSEDEFEQKKDSLPDICFAIKYPIQEIEKKPFPNLQDLLPFLKEKGEVNKHEGIQCKVAKEEIIGARYFSQTKAESEGPNKIINLSQSSFMSPSDDDIDPLIYIRFARPISQPNEELPCFEISKFYEKSEFHGIDIEILPNFKKEVCEQVIHFGNELFNEHAKLLDHFNPQRIKVLQEYIESLQLIDSNLDGAFIDLVQKRKAYTSLDPSNLIVYAQEVEKIIDPRYKSVLEVPEESYKLIQQILDLQCKYFLRFMNATANARSKMLSYEKHGWHLYINLLKKEMLSPAKKNIINKMITALPTSPEGAVTIMRRKAFYFMNSGQVDHEGRHTIFGQIFTQLKDSQFQCLAKNKVDSKCFAVTFKGEGSQDAGGPYRDTLHNMCQELQSGCLPLLILTPNNKNSHGQNRECWIPNPSAKSPAHFRMFKFFGALIGSAIRSTSALNLDLPPTFWKQILNEPLDILNLKEIDTFSWQIIEQLKRQAGSSSSQEFEESVDQRFVTLLSDGTEQELCFKGASRRVTQENLQEFINLTIETRLKEFDEQMKVIREGVQMIMPESILFFMSWQEIELRATGKKTFDIDILKKYTQYEGCDETSQTAIMFWNVIKRLTEEERSKYLKFVWGRSRLPMNMESLSRNHKLEFHKRKAKDSLPISHTCFFSIDLPEYSSEDMFYQRLVYAITFCGDIDADRGHHEIGEEDE